jgi:hypothetical protein
MPVDYVPYCRRLEMPFSSYANSIVFVPQCLMLLQVVFALWINTGSTWAALIINHCVFYASDFLALYIGTPRRHARCIPVFVSPFSVPAPELAYVESVICLALFQYLIGIRGAADERRRSRICAAVLALVVYPVLHWWVKLSTPSEMLITSAGSVAVSVLAYWTVCELSVTEDIVHGGVARSFVESFLLLARKRL